MYRFVSQGVNDISLGTKQERYIVERVRYIAKQER